MLYIQAVFWGSLSIHCFDVAKPPQAMPGQECKHAGDACLVENILFWYTSLPRDTKSSPDVAHVQRVKTIFLRE